MHNRLPITLFVLFVSIPLCAGDVDKQVVCAYLGNYIYGSIQTFTVDVMQSKKQCCNG